MTAMRQRMGHREREVAEILEREKEQQAARRREGRRPRHWEHLKYSELPPWMQDNEFILAHHRPVLRYFKIFPKNGLRVCMEESNEGWLIVFSIPLPRFRW